MSKKKIALLGNMNNNFNALCRYLRDRGYDARLFIFDYEIYPHFHPSADCYDDSWKEYTSQLTWGSARSFNKVSRSYLEEFFKEFDVLIGCGYAPAFVHKAGRKLNVFAPHGSDINHLPYLEDYSPKGLARFFSAGRSQRKGIVEADHLFSGQWTPDLEEKIETLGLKGKRHFSIIPFLYLPQYQNLKVDATDHRLKTMIEIKSSSDLIIFHHIRHSWVNPSDRVAMKANNFLFEGFAEFKAKNPGAKISIVTFEYGEDVHHTKELIKKLEIENCVNWFPITPRRDIIRMMQMADVITGEFYYSFVVYGAILEGMAMAKPVMHKRNDMDYPNQELYPMIHASSAQDVYIGIQELLKNPEKYKKMGVVSREWMQKQMIDLPLTELTSVIDSANA